MDHILTENILSGTLYLSCHFTDTGFPELRPKIISIKKIYWWSVTISYIGLTYATLGSMPSLWYRIDDILNGNGILFQYFLYSVVAFVLIVFLYRREFYKSGMNLLVFAGFFIAFCIMFYLEKYPGEKIHMFQYGIFGLLIFKTLSLHFNIASIHMYLTGGVLCLVAGAVDEVIQGILPNRTFTWHDVFINGLSGILVLMFIHYYFTQNRKNYISTKME